MYLHINGFIFAACISYVVAACKNGLTGSTTKLRVLEPVIPDLVGKAENAVEAVRSAVADLRNAEQVVGEQTAASLAKTAEAIAVAAQATLVGNQEVVVNIQQQLNYARSNLESELQQLVQSGRSAIAALKAASKAQNRFFTVATAVSEAQETDALAQVSLEEAKAKYFSQGLMLLQAKARKNQLLRKLLEAKKDLSTTVQAAHQAEAAAITAERNKDTAGNETALPTR